MPERKRPKNVIRSQTGRLTNDALTYKKGNQIKIHKPVYKLERLQEERLERFKKSYDPLALEAQHFFENPTTERKRKGLLKRLETLDERLERVANHEKDLIHPIENGKRSTNRRLHALTSFRTVISANLQLLSNLKIKRSE